MISIDELTTFLGWCLVFNISVLVLMLVAITVFKEGFARFNARLFGVSTDESKNVFFRLFYQFRLLVFFFNIVPWVVLLIMSGS